MGQKGNKLGFGVRLGYCLRPETILSRFIDLSSTTHV